MVIVLKNRLNYFFLKTFPNQINIMSLTTMGFFSLSKGGTTSLKTIYKHRGQ
jgi:hypothetical protein